MHIEEQQQSQELEYQHDFIISLLYKFITIELIKSCEWWFTSAGDPSLVPTRKGRLDLGSSFAHISSFSPIIISRIQESETHNQQLNSTFCKSDWSKGKRKSILQTCSRPYHLYNNSKDTVLILMSELTLAMRKVPGFKALVSEIEAARQGQFYTGCSLQLFEKGETILVHNSKLTHFMVLVEGSVLLARFGLAKQKSNYFGDRLLRTEVKDQTYFIGSKIVCGRLLPGDYFGFLGNEMTPKSGYDFLAQTNCIVIKVDAYCFSRTMARQYLEALKVKLNFIRSCLNEDIPTTLIAQYIYHISVESLKKGTVLLLRRQLMPRPFIVQQGQVLVCDLLPNTNFVQKRHKIIQAGKFVYLMNECEHDLLALTELTLIYFDKKYLEMMCQQKQVDLAKLACNFNFTVDYSYQEYLSPPLPEPVCYKTYQEELTQRVWRLQYKRDIMHEKVCTLNMKQTQSPQVFLLPEDESSLVARRKFQMDFGKTTHKQPTFIPKLKNSQGSTSKSIRRNPQMRKKLGLILERLGYLPTIRMEQRAHLKKQRLCLSKSKYHYFSKSKTKSDRQSLQPAYCSVNCISSFMRQ